MNLFLLGNAASGVYYAYEHSDGMGKAIVILLVISSIFTWTIMIDKAHALLKAKRLAERAIGFFRANCSNKKPVCANHLRREIEQTGGPIAEVYNAGVDQLVEFYEEAGIPASTAGRAGVVSSLTDAQLGAIEAVLERQVSQQIQQLETRVNLLATLVSVSPFLGLFGTVWGVMLAFCSLAMAGRADIQALAPGVSGALLTTVCGLIVAIPSLVGYNILTSTIRTVTIYMDNFTEEFLVQVKLEQLDASHDRGAGRGTPEE